MPKGMNGYEQQGDGGYTAPEYAAEGKEVVKNGGNDAIHVGKESTGEKYPR